MKTATDHAYRYQIVAERIRNMIREGSLKAGSRIPSLREMSSLMGVSLNTVREAYSKLEAQYVIEAIPQSGYYVRPLQEELKALPARDPATMDPERTSLCRIYGHLNESGRAAPGNTLGISCLSPDFYPSAQLGKAVQDILSRTPDDCFRYLMPPGYLPLREQICRINGEFGTPLRPDELVITNGCHESIFLALMVLCEPGDTVAVESPCYFNYFQMLEQLKLNVVEIPAVSEEGFSVDTLRFVLENDNIKVFFTISSFSNPLGFTMSPAKKREILNLMIEFDVLLMEDDIYGHLYSGKERPPTYYSLCRNEEERAHIIHCSSFSKILGPGLRLGWIAAGRYTEEVIRFKTLLNLGNATLLQKGLCLFLENYSFVKHLKRIRTRLARQILCVRRVILESFPEGTAVTQPQGGCVLWVTLPKGIDSMEIYREGGRESLLIAPGKLFSLKRDYSNCLRLNAGFWDSQIERSIRRVGEIARSLAEPGGEDN